MKWIKKNKLLTTLFSGLGTAILIFSLNFLCNKKDIPSNDSQTNNINENNGTVAKQIGTQNNYYIDSTLKNDSESQQNENFENPKEQKTKVNTNQTFGPNSPNMPENKGNVTINYDEKKDN
jgi:hypothetical protein